jgi:hypothetical protein
MDVYLPIANLSVNGLWKRRMAGAAAWITGWVW